MAGDGATGSESAEKNGRENVGARVNRCPPGVVTAASVVYYSCAVLLLYVFDKAF